MCICFLLFISYMVVGRVRPLYDVIYCNIPIYEFTVQLNVGQRYSISLKLKVPDSAEFNMQVSGTA